MVNTVLRWTESAHVFGSAGSGGFVLSGRWPSPQAVGWPCPRLRRFRTWTLVCDRVRKNGEGMTGPAQLRFAYVVGGYVKTYQLIERCTPNSLRRKSMVGRT